MKIRITPRPYGICPKPSLCKPLMTIFYERLWHHLSILRAVGQIDAVETLDIEVDQALHYTPLHFYIKINGLIDYHIKLDQHIGSWQHIWPKKRTFAHFIADGNHVISKRMYPDAYIDNPKTVPSGNMGKLMPEVKTRKSKLFHYSEIPGWD